jgi:outer membrane protein OmpA-like peptidoglycan-associated protein
MQAISKSTTSATRQSSGTKNAAKPALTKVELRILKVLTGGEVSGDMVLAELATGRRLDGVPERESIIAHYAQAAQRLARMGLICTDLSTGQLRYVLARERTTARKATQDVVHGLATRPTLKSSRQRLPHQTILLAGIPLTSTVMLIAGCMSMANHDAPSHRAYPELQGLGQSLDPKTGQVVFTSCNPCAGPTLKTAIDTAASARPTVAIQYSKSAGLADPAAIASSVEPVPGTSAAAPVRSAVPAAPTAAPTAPAAPNPGFASLFNGKRVSGPGVQPAARSLSPAPTRPPEATASQAGRSTVSSGVAAHVNSPMTPQNTLGAPAAAASAVGVPVSAVSPRLNQPAKPSQPVALASNDLVKPHSVAPVAQPVKTGMTDLKLDTIFESVKRVVPFSYAVAGMGPQGKQIVAELIPAARQAQRITVRGRTDGTGDLNANQKLALNRALGVRSAFVSQGVEQTKIKAVYCSTCYVADNSTEAGRRANRRVEVEMVMPANKVASLPPAKFE